jgi:fused signal recognition particle receptor
VLILFGLLKKKIKGFTEKVFNKSKDKIKEEPREEAKPKETKVQEEPLEEPKEKPKKDLTEQEEPKPIETKVQKEPREELKPTEVKVKEEVRKEPKAEKPKAKEEPKKEKTKQKTEDLNLEREKKEKIKKNVFTSIKGVFSKKIKLSEKELNDFLDDFELSLLEADVSIDAAKKIIDNLKTNFLNTAFDKNNLLEDIKKNIRKSLEEDINIDCDINNYINKYKKENEPFIIMFIGPNGAGKTTTIAKVANLFKKSNKKIILSSSDTFRAGSIQQLQKHADNLHLRLIKQDYGSDPAAVAWDAVNAAKKSNSDFVLIDTAGRQETNYNLMKELEKIKRVIKPNLIIYVGESQAGQSIIEQIRKFDEEINIDGVILTKIDTDPKGGIAISILNDLKKPIFYIGTGQEYKDLMPFSPQFIIKRIVE